MYYGAVSRLSLPGAAPELAFLRAEKFHRQVAVVRTEDVLQLVLHPSWLGLAAHGESERKKVHRYYPVEIFPFRLLNRKKKYPAYGRQ